MKHIVLHTCPAWGHTKPLTALMVLVAELRADVVTTFLAGAMYPKILEELSKLPPTRYQKIEDRINVIDVPNPTPDFMNNPAFAGAFKILLQSGTLTCASSGKSITGLPKPSLAIIDPFAAYAFEAIRKLAPPHELPIFAWMSASPLIREFGPESHGGKGDYTERVEKEVAETGGDPLEIGARIHGTVNNELIEIPGYPPMFDYEWFPQDIDLRMSAALLQRGRKYIHEADGTFCVSTRVLEHESIEVMENYLQEMGKELVCIGFVSSLFPQPPAGDEFGVVPFLDRVQRKHGEKSLVYIAFGTTFWPADPEKVYIVIDELIQNGTPFLFAYGSAKPDVPQEVKDKIASSGVGMAVPWAPQDTVLQHSSVGWFLTHGGWNSLQEGFRYRVPLIFWPMGADQPSNAALITLTHRASFELLSVRTGKYARRPYRCSEAASGPLFTHGAVREEIQRLLVSIKGEEGKSVRANAERLSDGISKVWEDGGEAQVSLEKFLEKYVDSAIL